jgi:iron(III) transport system substrate-binding protein
MADQPAKVSGMPIRRAISLLAGATVMATAFAATSASAAEVNVYSHRQEFLIRPFLEKFTAETGIDVNVVYAQKGMLERMKAEGQNSPADLVLTVDIARLDALAD